MNITRWVISVVILMFGIYMVAMNWAVFANNHILKKKWTSAVPLVGGMALAIGLLCIPIRSMWKYAWIPLFLDWGSFPVILTSLILKLREKRQPPHSN